MSAEPTSTHVRARTKDATPSASGAGPGAAPGTSCPGGCNGRKTARALLCRDCRRRANAVGAVVVQQLPTVEAPGAGPRRTAIQNSRYHGKLCDLATVENGGTISKEELNIAVRALKKRALAQASTMLGRDVTSSTDLTEAEMELLLEWLDREIDAAT
jgi:hypothetical protein